MTREPFALTSSRLTVHYGKNLILSDIDLTVPKGSLVGIIGPNGAGKSTLMKALLQLIPRSYGTVLFCGKPLEEMREELAYIPQRESVDWHFPISVRELVLMGRYGKLKTCYRPSKQDHLIVNEQLERLGIQEIADRPIGEISGGQQQRAFMARALCQEPSILFLDEPFIGIDIATEAALITLFKELCSQGKTIFIVHHALATATQYFDWIILLNKKLFASGKTDEVFCRETIGETYGHANLPFSAMF
jgi:manganese/zinc/iron transport system ATP- binding protein